MIKAIYGKAINRKFTPDDGSRYISIPTQNPQIYLFDYLPNYNQMVAGTNNIASVTTWTQGSGPEITYTIPAIDDPDQDGSLVEREYWESIAYKLESGEQTQYKLRMLIIERADVLESIPGVTYTDVLDIWEGAGNYKTNGEIDSFIANAEDLTRKHFGVSKWPRLYNLSELKLPLCYKAISLIAASEVAKGNSDQLIWMVDHYNSEFAAATANISLPIDNDGDGRPDSEVTLNNPSVFLFR